MLVAVQKLSRHKDVTYKTHFKILSNFSHVIFFFLFEYNYIVHLLPLNAKVVQWVQWRREFSLGYSQHLHQHPFSVAGAIPSPSLLHNLALCACSGAVGATKGDSHTLCPPPWKSMWWLRNLASFTPLEFHMAALNGFDCNLEALNLDCYILW